MQVEYIFKDHPDMNDPILRKLEEYCTRMNIPFEIRSFNPILYEHDRECITKIPAIHVYKKKEHYETVYPDEHPIQTIQLMYETFELENLEYLAKKQIWDEKLKYLKRLFKNGSLKTDSHITKNSN